MRLPPGRRTPTPASDSARFGDPIDSRVGKPLASTPFAPSLASPLARFKCHSAASNHELRPAMTAVAGSSMSRPADYRRAASISARRSRTITVTNSLGSGRLGVKRIVPLDVW